MRRSLVLPLSSSIAICVHYRGTLQDGGISVLHAAGLSNLSVCLPGIAAAALATIVGYGVSFGLAPAGVRQIQDTLYVLRNNLDPGLFSAGAFNDLGDGGATIRF